MFEIKYKKSLFIFYFLYFIKSVILSWELRNTKIGPKNTGLAATKFLFYLLNLLGILSIFYSILNINIFILYLQSHILFYELFLSGIVLFIILTSDFIDRSKYLNIIFYIVNNLLIFFYWLYFYRKNKKDFLLKAHKSIGSNLKIFKAYDIRKKLEFYKFLNLLNIYCLCIYFFFTKFIKDNLFIIFLWITIGLGITSTLLLYLYENEEKFYQRIFQLFILLIKIFFIFFYLIDIFISKGKKGFFKWKVFLFNF